MDFYSRVLDQRMSIVRRMKNQIMMRQNRQTSDTLTEHEEQDRRAAGYVDKPKNESYCHRPYYLVGYFSDYC